MLGFSKALLRHLQRPTRKENIRLRDGETWPRRNHFLRQPLDQPQQRHQLTAFGETLRSPFDHLRCCLDIRHSKQVIYCLSDPTINLQPARGAPVQVRYKVAVLLAQAIAQQISEEM